MSVNRASTIFGTPSLKLQRVFLHPWLIIELSPAFLGKTSLRQHRNYVLNMSVNGASTAFGLASWKMQGARGDIELSSEYRPPIYANMVATTLLWGPKTESEQSVNDIWRCIWEKARVVRRYQLIIKLSAAILGHNSSSKLLTLSQNERQWSVNDFWSCVLDNLMAMERN